MESTDVAVREPAAPVGLFGTNEPDLVVARAVKCADALKGVLVKKQLAKNIGGREYILVEGWTTLAAMVGLSASTEWSRPVGEGDTAGWEAAVVVTNSLGVQISRAEAQCLRAEHNWKSRDDFALRSMAQTRAMGKALRMPLGFIAVLAGYEATPAEEMPVVDDVPFDTGPAAQVPTMGRSTTAETGGGASTYADESDVGKLLELAARVGAEAHDKAVAAIVKHRGSHDDHVDRGWLARQRMQLEKKLPVAEPEQEPMFVPPPGAAA